MWKYLVDNLLNCILNLQETKSQIGEMLHVLYVFLFCHVTFFIFFLPHNVLKVALNPDLYLMFYHNHIIIVMIMWMTQTNQNNQ